MPVSLAVTALSAFVPLAVLSSLAVLLKALHGLAFQFKGTLNLLRGQELAVAFVVLLPDVQNLLAALKTFLDGLVGLGIRHFRLLLVVQSGTERPYLLLVIAEGLNIFLGGGVVKSQLFCDMLGLGLGKLLPAHTLVVTVLVLSLNGCVARHHDDGSKDEFNDSLHINKN